MDEIYLTINVNADLAEWIKHQSATAKEATVLGSIPASSDTVESVG